jgi:protein-tyrosine-phosphatase
MTKKPYNILFLCTGNSARSILAECILNHEGEGLFKAFSAGSHPAGEVNPFALNLLRLKGFETSGLRSKSWDEFMRPDAPRIDFIFTVCDNAAGETCPLWPGHPVTAHWGVPDPAAFSGPDAEKAVFFADVYRMLFNRISVFVNLPLRRLEGEFLRKSLDAIGRSRE